MFRFIENILILVLTSTVHSLKCISLKNEECNVRKVIADNNYMTFSYKIKVDKCVGSCNDVKNPYFKVYSPDIVKNGSVKVFDLISQQSSFRNITFHESCKCGCLLDESSSNVVNCRCEFKKVAKLITTEECDVETNDIIENKTISVIKKIENCKPFVASSISFVCISVISTGIMIYFCLKSRKNKVLSY